MKIPIFRLSFDSEYREEFRAKSERIFDEAFLTNHSFVKEFEQQFAEWSGSDYALATASGTSALEGIFRALNVEGREVIVPAATFIATAVAVKNAGGIPVVADIEPEYLCLSPKKVVDRLSERTAAVVVVHVGGIISPAIIEIQNICREQGVPLIEDCAHAHGATFNGTAAGRFGTAGAFSFHTTKVMTTGEGGAVVCNDPKFAERVRSSRQFGVDEHSPLLHRQGGANGKMTEMQGLMGLLELKRVEKRIALRQDIARRYQERLRGSCWRPYKPTSASRCPYYKQILSSPVEWTEVRDHLIKNGIALTGGVYHFPLNVQPAIGPQEACPVADRFSRFHVCPPCYPELELHEVDYICDRLLELSR